MSKFALCFAGLLAIAPASAAELSQIGPLASGKSLLAARAQIKEDGVETTVKMTGGDKPDTVTLDIAEDFAVAYHVTNGTIYDFAQRRLLVLDDKARTVRNASLYAYVDFAVSETANRRMQRGALKTVKVTGDTAMLDPFWVQSELHIMAPQDGSPIIVRRADKDGSVHFSYDKKEVASYSLSKQVLTKAQSATLAKYLRYASTLHPTIIDEIAASGRMPSRIAFDQPPMRKLPQAVWVFEKPIVVKSVYPVRDGIKPDAAPTGSDVGSTTVRDLLPVMQSAITGNAPGRKSAADFHAAIDAAMNKKKFFQAAVLGFEFNLQYGAAEADCAAPCHSLKDVFAAANADPRTQVLVKALQPANADELEASIKALTDLKRDDLSNPYMIDDFLANDLSESGHNTEALPLFANAIKGNPYLAGYYKDLGDVFRRSFSPDLTWLCYDLGRMLPGGANAPVIGHVTEQEAELVKAYPEFF